MGATVANSERKTFTVDVAGENNLKKIEFIGNGTVRKLFEGMARCSRQNMWLRMPRRGTGRFVPRSTTITWRGAVRCGLSRRRWPRTTPLPIRAEGFGSGLHPHLTPFTDRL
jgi:hypothetical protein